MDKEQQGIPVVCDRREERIVNSGDRDALADGIPLYGSKHESADGYGSATEAAADSEKRKVIPLPGLHLTILRFFE